MAKKGTSGMAGGALLFLGSIVYLYVVFTWVNSGGAPSAWLGMAAFLAPFVAAGAVVSAITLFFMSIGQVAGKMADDMKDMVTKVLWKFVMFGGVTTLILTGGTAWFYYAVLGFVLTYIGAMMGSM